IVVEEDLVVISRSPLRVVAVSICTLPPGPGRSNFFAESRFYARRGTRESGEIKLLAQMCARMTKDPAFSQHSRGADRADPAHVRYASPPRPAISVEAPIPLRRPRPAPPRAEVPLPGPCAGSEADPSPRAARSAP